MDTIMPSNEERNLDILKNSIEELIFKVKNGEINPLELLVISSIFKDLHEYISSELREDILNEASKYPEKEFTYKGYKIVKQQKTTYDFQDSDIIKWEKAIKDRKELLKKLTEPIVFESTGEIIYPPTKKVTEYVYIKKELK